MCISIHPSLSSIHAYHFNLLLPVTCYMHGDFLRFRLRHDYGTRSAGFGIIQRGDRYKSLEQ